MNGLIPALLAVLLAEAGPRGAGLALARGHATIVFVVAAVVAGSAVAGGLVAPRMTPDADALLIALALGFGGWAQVGRIAPVATTAGALWTFWRGGTALIVFALAARFAPVAVGIGAAIGLICSAVLGGLLGERATRVRRACALILVVAAAVVAAFALRLV